MNRTGLVWLRPLGVLRVVLLGVLHAALRGALPAACASVLFLLAAPAAVAQLKPIQRVQITDPYLELHTGPGRGYPVFYVAAREEWVEIVLRRTDWYKVRVGADRADGGKEGWVKREQLETTLTESGSLKTFRDVLLDDYLKRRVELGAAWGRFDSDPMLKLFLGVRLSDTLSLEATLGQVQGVFSGTDFWHINLNVEPWSDQRWSPYFGVGFGKFKNIPNSSLVGAQTVDANLANAGVGLRYYLNDRFVIRADYSIYTAFVEDARSTEYRAITAGISFFF